MGILMYWGMVSSSGSYMIGFRVSDCWRPKPLTQYRVQEGSGLRGAWLILRFCTVGIFWDIWDSR